MTGIDRDCEPSDFAPSVIDRVASAMEILRDHQIDPLSFQVNPLLHMKKIGLVYVDENQFHRLFLGQSVEREKRESYYVYRGDVKGVLVEWWQRITPCESQTHIEQVEIH